MFSDATLWITILILFLVFASGLYFILHISEYKPKKRRHRARPLKAQEQKDWKEVSLRLEKHVHSVRKENIGWQKRVKILEKEAEIFKQKNQDLVEKLKRERVWQEKEKEDSKKKNLRIKQLEEALRKTEHNMEQEHAELLILKREQEDTATQIENQEHQIKYLQKEVQNAQAQSDNYRKEILELRAQNKKLSQKQEDVQWIAKSVHVKVKEELHQAQQEIERLKAEKKTG